MVTSQYFDWCPEAVVVVHAATHTILSCNHAFQSSVAPISDIIGTNVLEALFPQKAHAQITSALRDVCESPKSCLVSECTTRVRLAGGDQEGLFDWLVKAHGLVVALSGRACSNTSASPSRRSQGESSTNPQSSCQEPPRLLVPPSQEGRPGGPVRLAHLRAAKSEVEFDQHNRCFNRDDTARRIQEARQFAELKAYGELLQQKDAFMDKIFHEIRTPSHTLQMITRMLMDAVKDNAELQGQLETAWAQSVHICKLADDVKSAIALQSGAPPKVHPTWFPLSALTEETHELVRKLFPAKSNIELQVVFDPTVPCDLQLRTDRDMLSMVLRHLLTNGMKFTERGRVTLTVHRARPIADSQQDQLTFSVLNTGAPIALSAVYQMGQRYWQGPDAAKDSKLCEPNGGFGLGLHLSFNYVKVMGGELEVKPSSEGTTFSFSISAETMVGGGAARTPTHAQAVAHSISQTSLSAFNAGITASASVSNFVVALDTVAPVGEASQSSDQGLTCTQSQNVNTVSFNSTAMGSTPHRKPHSGADPDAKSAPAKRASRWRCLVPWAGPRPSMPEAAAPAGLPMKRASYTRRAVPHVLVVEDNMICQKVVCKCLERIGFSYAVASNGKMACDLVEGNPSNYDVVLMDLRMPVMDGIAATQYIRRELKAQMPIIVFSAEVGEATLEQVARAGATDFLPKPATPQMVVDMLRKHCPQ